MRLYGCVPAESTPKRREPLIPTGGSRTARVMTLRLRHLTPLSVLFGLSVIVACGSDPAPPAQPPPPPPPAAKAEPAPEPEPEPESTGAPDAGADAAAQASAPQSSGRTPLFKSDDESITDTFGSSPAAKLELGDDTGRAVLRIPENALSQGINLTFKIDKKGKTLGPPVGKIYRITAIVPPGNDPQKIESVGPAFELAMPAGDKKDANLAIGEIVTDEKGKQKLQWTIVAPTRIDDATGVAHFELKALPDSFLHITTKAPTEPKQ